LLAQVKIESPTAVSIAAKLIINIIMGSISALKGCSIRNPARLRLEAFIIISIPKRNARKLLEVMHWRNPTKKRSKPAKRSKPGMENKWYYFL